MYLLERGLKDLIHVTTWAQQYLAAHKQQLKVQSKTTVQPRRAEQRKSIQFKPDTSQGRQTVPLSRNVLPLPRNVLQKCSTPVSQSSRKKILAMVTQSSEDYEEALTCVKMKRPRSKGNLKKSGTHGSTSKDRKVYHAVCRDQITKGQTYIRVGKLNGWAVKLLRDNGCRGMIVDRALVPYPSHDGDTRQFRLPADGGPYPDRCVIG